jgi:hypothetical protein
MSVPTDLVILLDTFQVWRPSVNRQKKTFIL